MAKIKYSLGQERDIVVEKIGYNDSIFRKQYIRAISLMARFIDSRTDHSLKLIAFCGDRGEGKTSCTSTVIDILKRSDARNAEPDREIKGFLQKCDARNTIRGIRFAFTDIIDPSCKSLRVCDPQEATLLTISALSVAGHRPATTRRPPRNLCGLCGFA